MKYWIGIALVSLSPWAWSQQSAATVAVAEAATQGEACQRAFSQTEDDALENFGLRAADAGELELRERTDERLGVQEDGRFACRVSTVWALLGDVLDEAPLEEPMASGLADEFDLLGSEQRISGVYRADCTNDREGVQCRRQIERDAADDLMSTLVAEYGISRNDYQLRADGFEGSQRFSQRNRDTTLTMDGTFYFRVEEASTVSQQPVRPARPPGTEAQVSIERRSERRERGLIENFDLTLGYAWDSNNSARSDELALSAERWNFGIWANNRVGASFIIGTERAGIANDSGRVVSESGSYAIRGIGLGYRMFDNRSVTLENMLHYIDARTYRTTLDPGCSGCTPREYESDDYLQATVNLKTNTKGLNLGWMLTWKMRPDLSNYDSLSGGFYIELQL